MRAGGPWAAPPIADREAYAWHYQTDAEQARLRARLMRAIVQRDQGAASAVGW